MIEPPETAGQPNTVDCIQYVRQWAIDAGYHIELTAKYSMEELLLIIAAGMPE